MNLTQKQKQALRILQKYPNDIVMSDGWLTGGHGIRLDLRTFNSLKEKGFVNRWGERRDQISESGKAIKLEPE